MRSRIVGWAIEYMLMSFGSICFWVVDFNFNHSSQAKAYFQSNVLRPITQKTSHTDNHSDNHTDKHTDNQINPRKRMKIEPAFGVSNPCL